MTDEEMVVNWGTCNQCFDSDYEAYLRGADLVAFRAVQEQGIGE